jgi:hypothetical protein
MSNAGAIFFTHDREVVRFALTDYDVRKDHRFINTNYDVEFDVRDLPEAFLGADERAVQDKDPRAQKRVIMRAIDAGHFVPRRSS